MEEVSTGARSTTLVTVAGGNFVQLGTRFLIGAVVPLLLVHFDTSRATIGLALTGMWAVYALTQFPSGMLADRYGERLILLVALTTMCGGVLLVALAPSLVLFTAAVLVLGVGAGLYFSPGVALVTRLYANRGQAIGVVTASGALAGLVFPAVGGVVGVRSGWRTAVSLVGAATLVVLVATVITVPRTSPMNRDRDLRALVDFDRHWALLTRPSIAYSLVIGVLTAFTFQAVSSFFPTFLVEFRGLGTDVAGVAFGLIFGLSAVSQPIVGRFSDLYSRDVALGASICASLVGVVILIVAPTAAGLVLGISLLGVGISWPGPVQARFFDLLSDGERGYGYGLARTAYMLLASTSSVIVGALVDLSGWVAGLGCLVVVLSTCLVMLGVNWRYELNL